jgi:uncharacterized membrane protein
MKKAGTYLFSLATISAGILDLVWGDFDSGHQPIGDLGVHIPALATFAYITGIWLIVSGTAILGRRTMKAGALMTGAIYLVFGLFSLPLFSVMIHKYGFHLTLILGILGRMFQQFIVVAGCVVLYASVAPTLPIWRERAPLVARWTFGLSSALFGVAHLSNVKGPLSMVPKWIPLGATFWVIFTGIAFLLAGIAILSGILSRLATWLLLLMLVIFEVALVPIIFGYPHVHQAWGASAYNLAVAGAVWIFATSTPTPARE